MEVAKTWPPHATPSTPIGMVHYLRRYQHNPYSGVCASHSTTLECTSGQHQVGTACIPDSCSAADSVGQSTACISVLYVVVSGACTKKTCGSGFTLNSRPEYARSYALRSSKELAMVVTKYPPTASASPSPSSARAASTPEVPAPSSLASHATPIRLSATRGSTSTSIPSARPSTQGTAVLGLPVREPSQQRLLLSFGCRFEHRSLSLNFINGCQPDI